VNPTGNALEMVKANVNSDVSLNDGFRAEGMVHLLRVTIGSNLECLGGEFYRPDGRNLENPPAGLVRYALEADHVRAMPSNDTLLGMLFWLRDESLEDSANLPDPAALALEIAEELEAALEQFAAIAEDLKG
jgi:hypothetical protein